MESAHKFQIVDIVNERLDLLQKEIIKMSKKELKKFNESLFPLNAKESTLVLVLLTNKFLPLGTQDFIAQCLYLINHKEYKKVLDRFQQNINILEFINDEEDNDEENLKNIREMSIILRFVNRELKKLNLNPLEIFRAMYIDDEITKALLSGRKEDWVKYKDWKINFPEEMKEKTISALTIFVTLYLKIRQRSIPVSQEEVPLAHLCHYAIILCKVYKKVQSEYPDAYRIWKNYVVTNKLAGYDFKNLDNTQMLYWLEIVNMNYKNYLDSYFDIIYNDNYTMEYRKNIIQLLEGKNVAGIVPYYEEYCKEHNISPDRYYYLGDIPEKHEESRGLSFIDSESPDKDTEQHFGLALKSNQVEYLYNELKGTYLDASTDIRLFCYRLTGKGKPDKIEKLKWVSDDDSLAVFIKHLGVSKNKCWQKTESFFGNKNENLKSRYHRLTKQKGKLKVNDINLTNLDNILASIKTNA